MKRILFVRRAYSFGGVERRLLDWLHHIDYSQCEVYVVSPVDVFSERIRSKGLPAKVVQLSQEEKKTLFGSGNPLHGKDDLAKGHFWEFFGPWFRFLRRLRPDHIVMMEGYFFSFPLSCVLAAYIVSRGHVYMTDHSVLTACPPPRTTKRHFRVLPGLGLWWYAKVWPSVWPWRMRARLSRRILCASQNLLERESAFYGYPEKKMRTIPHGVETRRFRPSPEMRQRWRELHRVPTDDCLIVCASRFSREKRVDWLLRAFLHLTPSHRNLRLLLLGDGPLRSEIEAIASVARGRDPSLPIVFLGHVEDVLPALQASDIYVLPSENEGFGIALTEAMATGLVCVSTRTSGPSEIITNGANGFLVEVSEAGVISGLKEALRLNPEERAKMVARARQTVMARYELQSVVSLALRLLDIETRKEIPEVPAPRAGQLVAPLG